MPRRSRRNEIPKNDVSQLMNAFFHGLSTRHPVEVAFEYAKCLHQADVKGLLLKKQTDPESTYYVGLSCGARDFASITKRTSLISNTLLLSHETAGEYREIQQISDNSEISERIDAISAYSGNARLTTTTAIGVQCPDLAVVGDWILKSEKLLRAGLAWYLPSYVKALGTVRAGTSYTPDQTLRRLLLGPDPVDYLVRDRHAIDASGANPAKGRFVRPILRINLPFLDGVSLQDFSAITVNEFDSYRELRNYLRTAFHQLDDAMDAVQLERELIRIGLEMEGEILKAASGMHKARKKGSINSLGAGIGTVAATLVAVYGPAFKEVLSVLGFSGGAWSLLTAMSERNPRDLMEGKWYYVWALGEAQRSAS